MRPQCRGSGISRDADRRRDGHDARVVTPKITDGDPIVLLLSDAFNFFKVNRDELLIGRIALEAFGAIRYTTAGKI